MKNHLVWQKSQPGSKQEGQTIAERLAEHLAANANKDLPSGTVLLLDLSGSMWWEAGTGRTRIEELARLLDKLPPARRFGFAGDCHELTLNEDVRQTDVGGGTDMERAFQHLKAQGIHNAILISDGLPTCPEDKALAASQGLHLDIFYVGPEPVPGFLRRLAAQTGGTFHRGQFTTPAALETKIRGLLGGPGREAVKL